MKRIENHCVDCGLPCLGRSCPYNSVPVYYCDECGEYAEYRIEDSDLCDSCAKEHLQEVFDNLTITEKAELLEVSCDELD